MLPQASPTNPIDIPVFEESDRLGFNFRAFAEKYGFDGAQGGGAHMWREEWDETVSHIYQHTLSESEEGLASGAVLTRLLCYREGGAAVWEDAAAGSIRGAQADEKVPLDVWSTVTPLVSLPVVTLVIRRDLLSAWLEHVRVFAAHLSAV